MQSNRKILAVDLDDVLCERSSNYEYLGPLKYHYCKPIQENIDAINKLYGQGNYIVIYTARGMSQFKGDVDVIKNKLYDLTFKQLKEWGVKFDELVMGKIHYDLIIDDKALNSKDLWSLL